MKKLIILSAALIAGLALSACAEQRAANMAPGTYESKSMAVDSAGTKYEKRSKTKVSVDNDGDRTVTMENETSKDPEGLFNKSTSKSKKVIKTND